MNKFPHPMSDALLDGSQLSAQQMSDQEILARIHTHQGKAQTTGQAPARVSLHLKAQCPGGQISGRELDADQACAGRKSNSL